MASVSSVERFLRSKKSESLYPDGKNLKKSVSSVGDKQIFPCYPCVPCEIKVISNSRYIKVILFCGVIVTDVWIGRY